MRIMGKLLVPTISAIVIGSGLLAFITYSLSEQAMSDALEQQAVQVAESAVSQLNTTVDDIVLDLEQLSEDVTLQFVVKSEGKMQDLVQKAEERLHGITGVYKRFEAVGIAGRDGTVLACSIPEETGRLNLRDRDYFRKALNGQPSVSDALRSRTTDQPAFVVAVPMRNNGEIIGVFYGSVSLRFFAGKFIKPIRIGEKGYAYMLARSGLVCSHPDESVLFREDFSKRDWGRTILEEGNGSITYEWGGATKIVEYRREPITGWIVAVSAEKDDIFSSVNSVRNSSVVITVGIVFVVALIVFFIVRNIVRSLDEAVEFAKTVADGDIEHELALRRGDEIGILADSLRAMVANLRKTIATATQQKAAAEEQSDLARKALEEADEARSQADSARREGMLQAAGELEGIVSRLIGASDGLASSIDQAAHGSEIQKERTTETATAIEQMNATVMEVARSASDAARNAEQARERAEEGDGVVDSVIEAIEEVSTRSNELKISLAELGTQAEGIGAVMSVISDIADQTNLLALNAAIEAARAGDAGRGFAVVADEVRKLAEKTMNATREVEQVVSAIQLSTQKNIEGMETATAAVARSTDLASDAGGSLKAIVGIVQDTADQVRSIATASEEQSAASEQINRSAEEINDVAGETALTMAESASAVNELAGMSRELTALMESLKNA